MKKIKRSPTSSKDKDVKKLIRKVKRIRNELDDVMTLVEEFDELVDEKSKKFITDKVKSYIKKEVKRSMKSVKLILGNDISNHYFDFVKKITDERVKQEIEKTSRMESKVVNTKDSSQISVLELMKEGWRLVFHGELNKKASSEEPDTVFIFERPVLRKQIKVPTKKKVKRKPA